MRSEKQSCPGVLLLLGQIFILGGDVSHQEDRVQIANLHTHHMAHHVPPSRSIVTDIGYRAWNN
jgi:hypothetical protein